MSQPTEIEITACVRAMVRSEAWSSFWSEEDARKLVKAVLVESRKPRDADGYPLPIDQWGDLSLPDRERAVQAIRRGVPLGEVVKCACYSTPPTRNGCFGVCEDSVAAIIASYEDLRREIARACPGCDGHECDAGCQYPAVSNGER